MGKKTGFPAVLWNRFLRWQTASPLQVAGQARQHSALFCWWWRTEWTGPAHPTSLTLLWTLSSSVAPEVCQLSNRFWWPVTTRNDGDVMFVEEYGIYSNIELFTLSLVYIFLIQITNNLNLRCDGNARSWAQNLVGVCIVDNLRRLRIVGQVWTIKG